jgi:hypothetical protein
MNGASAQKVRVLPKNRMRVEALAALLIGVGPGPR